MAAVSLAHSGCEQSISIVVTSYIQADLDSARPSKNSLFSKDLLSSRDFTPKPEVEHSQLLIYPGNIPYS